MSIKWEDHIELKILKEVLSSKYEPLAYLGGGGFGKVFKVKDKTLERICALKVLNFRRLDLLRKPKREEIKKRFIREAKIYANCTHPYIVQIYEIGGEDSFPYISIQYIEGKTLNDEIAEKGKLEFIQILEISKSILPALEHMHKTGIVHRDLKPPNIMIENETDKIVIIDFGFAKKLDASSLITTGTGFGTPSYLAPELWKDFKKAEPGADIYSYGVMLYEMLTGEVPFKGENQVDVMHGHLYRPVPDARLRNPKAPRGTQKIIKKTMAKKPQNRYSSAGELLNALKALKTNDENKRNGNIFKRLFLFLVAIMVAAGIILLLKPWVGSPETPVKTKKQAETHQTDLNDKQQAGEEQRTPRPNKSKPRAKEKKETSTPKIASKTRKKESKKVNRYEIKSLLGDKVVIDHRTNLMWHSSGSQEPMEFKDVKKWLDDFNQKGCAGYSDWRLPTCEEAASLLEKISQNNRFANPVFSKEQRWIWTSDPSGENWYWTVSFEDGRIHENKDEGRNYIRPVRSHR